MLRTKQQTNVFVSITLHARTHTLTARIEYFSHSHRPSTFQKDRKHTVYVCSKLIKSLWINRSIKNRRFSRWLWLKLAATIRFHEIDDIPIYNGFCALADSSASIALDRWLLNQTVHERDEPATDRKNTLTRIENNNRANPIKINLQSIKIASISFSLTFFLLLWSRNSNHWPKNLCTQWFSRARFRYKYGDFLGRHFFGGEPLSIRSRRHYHCRRRCSFVRRHRRGHRNMLTSTIQSWIDPVKFFRQIWYCNSNTRWMAVDTHALRIIWNGSISRTDFTVWSTLLEIELTRNKHFEKHPNRSFVWWLLLVLNSISNS